MSEVSIIIPVYRATEYIAEALDSVFDQIFRDFEAIVVNDGCPDTVALERVLEPYRSRIVYLRLEKNVGLAAARNAGIRAASGRYIALLDADDAWEPNYLQTQIGILKSRPEWDVVYSNARFFGAREVEGLTTMDLNPSRGEVTFISLMSLQCSVFVSVTGKREIFLKAGLFEEGRRRVEDFDMWLRIVKAGGRIGYHRAILARSRRRGGSLSANEEAMLIADIEVAEKAKRTLDLTPEERTVTDQQIRRWQGRLDVIHGKKALGAGRMQDAAQYFGDAYSQLRTPKTALIAGLARVAPRLLAWMVRDRAI